MGKLPNNGSVFLVLLHLGILEVLDEVVEALKARVGQIADLDRNGFTFSERKRAHFFPWKR
jgi:hypothetical protein